MKLAFVCVGSDLKAMGFRRIAAIAKELNPPTEVYYVLPENIFYVMLKGKRQNKLLSENDIEILANHLAKADMVCFSAFSLYADLVNELLAAIKKVNRKTFLVWGGVHPIVDPENAIRHADAICVGEGELAFPEFFTKYTNGEDYQNTKDFHFRTDEGIIKNGFLPLLTSEQMDQMPLPIYADNEFIFDRNKGFVPLGLKGYLKYNSLGYSIVWSIGCPYKCSYCSNSKFIDNDKNYRKLRYPSVSRLIAEVKAAINKHPHISTIAIHDDSFMALPYEIIREFATLWKKEVNLPFAVTGIIPNYVKKEKVQILTWAGMNRVRMGVQSGSDRILDFYKRPNDAAAIQRSTSIIAEFNAYMIPPAYDFIVDNPMESKQDVIDTLEVAYKLPRPFTLNIFSLRVIPNTNMADDFKKLGISHQPMNKSITLTEPTLPNILLYLMPIIRPPRWLFNILLDRVGAYGENKHYTIVGFIAMWMYVLKRALDHLLFMDFFILPGKIGWVFWRLGIIGLWNKKILKNYPSPV